MNDILGAVPASPEARLMAALVLGDKALARSLFVGEPDLNDPCAGQVTGTKELDDFVDGFQRNFRAQSLHATFKKRTLGEGFSGTEVELTRVVHGQRMAVPAAIVGELSEAGLLRARIYYSRKYINGKPHVRPAIFRGETTKPMLPQVREYLTKLEEKDPDAMIALFEDDPYLIGAWPGEIKVGREQVFGLYKTMYEHFTDRTVQLEHINVFDDGVTSCVEFVSLADYEQGESGIAFYELGPTGRILAARITDETN